MRKPGRQRADLHRSSGRPAVLRGGRGRHAYVARIGILPGRVGACMRIITLLVLAAALAAPPAALAKSPAPGVRSTLDAMERAGRIGAADHARYDRLWVHSLRAARRLHGAARWNFAGVLANTRSLARRRLLAARVAPAFLTLERNFDWFWNERHASLPYGARRTFAGSPLIFQFYPGSGWQIQMLGSFGRLNALARSRRTSSDTLTELADALLAVSNERRGFLAFEYLFPWSGGAPGWISGMATATGAQALTRVWRRTGDARYRDAAESMLGAFFRAPPWGVRVTRGAGRAHYVLYSQSPRMFVGNGFAQTLIALEELSRTLGGTRVSTALERGLNQADAGMRRYDTGAWSLYWRRPGTRSGDESDLHYHRLLTGFLGKLCRRLPERGDFCDLRDRFRRYETEPVAIGPIHARRSGHALVIRVRVSKRGSGTLTLGRGTRALRRGAVALRRGMRTFRLPLPRRGGSYTLRLAATSLNGVSSSRERTLRLR